MHYVKFAQSVLYRAAGLDVVWPQVAIVLALWADLSRRALARFRTMLARAV